MARRPDPPPGDCPRCRTPLDPGSPGGLCSRCLLALGLDGEPGRPAGGGRGLRPSPEEPEKEGEKRSGG